MILYQITSTGHRKLIAHLAGASAPAQAVIANGHLALRELDGSIAIFTTKGRPLATIPAKANQVALTASRVVVHTTNHQLAVYNLQGSLVHTWPLAHHLTALAAYGRYAAFTDDHTVRAIRLSNGTDRDHQPGRQRLVLHRIKPRKHPAQSSPIPPNKGERSASHSVSSR